MLMSPPCVYSSPGLGCPPRGRADVGPPHTGGGLGCVTPMSRRVVPKPIQPHPLEGPCPHGSPMSPEVPQLLGPCLLCASTHPSRCHPWVPGLAQGLVLCPCPSPQVHPEHSVSPRLGGDTRGGCFLHHELHPSHSDPQPHSGPPSHSGPIPVLVPLLRPSQLPPDDPPGPGERPPQRRSPHRGPPGS